MSDIINDTEISLQLIRFCGFFCVLLPVLYILTTKFLKNMAMHSWKALGVLSLSLGLLDAGISLLFGKVAFITTSLIVVSFFLLWIVSKNPLWRFKHLLFLVSLFIICSTTFFYGIAGLFFHLAVEGKL